MVIFLLAGCTTLQPLAGNAETLRDELRSGETVTAGDKVRVVSRDGLSRLIIVTALDENTLRGHPEGVETQDVVVAIPIDDIVFMEGKKTSVGKTVVYGSGVAVGGAAATVAIIFVLLAMMFA
jgi:hypothetical protein